MKYLFFVVLGIMSCNGKKLKQAKQVNFLPELASQDSTNVRTIRPDDLKIGPEYSTSVISNAQKYVIPVPSFGPKGELLVYPEKHPKAGQTILDYQGKPIGDRGIVFFNEKDQSWQAASGDGQSVVIINEVTQQQAKKLDRKIRELQSNPEKLSLSQLKQALNYAQQDLMLKDMYNSTRSFIREKMTPVNFKKRSSTVVDDVYGLKKRDDRDINQAIYIPGAFQFEGPAASPQKFTKGGIIIEQGGKMRGIQPDIFMRTYTLLDGSQIKSISEVIKMQKEN